MSDKTHAKTMRVIWTDRDALGVQRDLDEGVYAIVGPIHDHMAEFKFQNELTILALRRNRRFSFVSFGRFIALLKKYTMTDTYYRRWERTAEKLRNVPIWKSNGDATPRHK